MKMMKKIGAIVLAIMMIAVVATAFAAANTGSSAYKSNGSENNDYAKVDDNTFSIPKEIVLFNVDASEIFEPNIEFTYEVSSVAVTAGEVTVTGLILDGNGTSTTSAVVRSGVSGAVTIQGRKVDQYIGTTASTNHAVTGTAGTTTTLTFGGDNGTKLATLDEGTEITTSNAGGTNGKVATGYIDVTINAATIYAADKGPGIYRYKISDTTTTDTLTAAGITRPTGFVKDLYLDVYVKNNSAGTGYEVYGYVLFKEAASGSNAQLDIEYGSGTIETVKADGFTVLSSGVTSTSQLVDQYHTYNVEITKTTTGALADTRNNFPFQVDLTNSVVTSQDDFYYVITKDATASSEVTDKLSNTGSKTIGSATSTGADNLLLQNGDKILITGLPVSTKIDVTEYNNTTDIYTVTAQDEGDATLTLDNTVSSGTAASDVDSVPMAASQTASLHTTKDIDHTDSKDVVAITNSIETISPTGYVTRFAPYALMLIGGIVLLIVAKKHKKHTEED